MTTYMQAHEFLRPIPYHALTPGAIEAVEAMKVEGDARLAARVVDRLMSKVVTKHGNPRRPVDDYDGDAVTANARRLLARALDLGFTARLHDLGSACMVEGYRLAPKKVGFRAWWTRGSADGASWHEPWRYEVVPDKRAIGIDQKARTAKVGYRGAGTTTERLAIVATPWGKPINHTVLGRLLDEYDA